MTISNLQIGALVMIALFAYYIYHTRRNNSKPSVKLQSINNNSCLGTLIIETIKPGDIINLDIVVSVVDPNPNDVLLLKGGIIVDKISNVLDDNHIINIKSSDIKRTPLSVSSQQNVTLQGYRILSSNDLRKITQLPYIVSMSALSFCSS